MSLERLFPDAMNRRAFVSRMAMAGLGAAAMAYLGNTVRAADAPAGEFPDPKDLPGIPGRNQDQAVLNYALTLEILEADLYRQALNRATGREAGAPLENDPSAYRLRLGPGRLNGKAADAAFAYLVNFAAAEAAHRDFLRTAIEGQGGTPVQPNPGGYHFPNGPGDALDTLLDNLIVVEEVGVRAYLGASTLVNDYGLLTAAASIYSTECSHSSAIRVALGETPGPVKMKGDQQAFPADFSEGELEYYLEPKQVLEAVQPYIVH
jgi:hypothetical protein